MCVIRERGEQEDDLARAWWQLAPSSILSLEDGRRCLLLYNGQPGGPAGPDVRDAVLRLLSRGSPPHTRGKSGQAGPERGVKRDKGEMEAEVSSHLYTQEKSEQAVPEIEAEETLTGDVEFHLRAGDWFAHGHHADPRYNQVILHVIRYPDAQMPARRQDGASVPACSLLDLTQPPEQIPTWPCQQRSLAPQELTTTLLRAGLQRFVEKSQALYRVLTQARPTPGGAFHVYDTCLLPALAEGLGYGRDRAFFRAAGQRLVGLPARLPEPLGHTPTPAPLDVSRLRVLRLLAARWRQAGVWYTLSQALRPAQSVKVAATALRAALYPLNRARADILIINIILPFAAAVAELENDVSLTARAQQIYLAYPGLASNRITRMMKTQLRLAEEPAQACLQQGLHHIYAQTCRAKDCRNCLCGGRRL